MTRQRTQQSPEGRSDSDGGRFGGISRRRVLKSTGVAGVAASSAGCLGDDSSSDATVFVFNTGDMTVSLIDAVEDELLRSEYIGTTSSWPANQYAAIQSGVDTLWMNVEGGIFGFDAREQLSQVADIPTETDANWQELTPEGDRLIVSSREPVHTHFLVDADRDSDSFGDVLDEIDRSDEDPQPAPCDITVGPDGEYSYCPDLGADYLTVVQTEPFEIATRLELEPLAEGPVEPFMATASWDGNYVAIENFEGEEGTESIIDTSDPEAPEELERFTTDDGLGPGPTTSEWGPDNELVYVFTDEVTVIDVTEMEVTEHIDVGGSVRTGTWDPDQTKLYVPVQENDEVAVIDHESVEQVDTIEVGAAPRSATARSVRPSENVEARFLAAMASIGLTDDDEVVPTCCEEGCACGSRLGTA